MFALINFNVLNINIGKDSLISGNVKKAPAIARAFMLFSVGHTTISVGSPHVLVQFTQSGCMELTLGAKLFIAGGQKALYLYSSHWITPIGLDNPVPSAPLLSLLASAIADERTL